MPASPVATRRGSSPLTSDAVNIVRRFDEAVVYEADFDKAMTFANEDLTIREAPGLPYRSPYVGKQGLVELMTDVGEQWDFDGPLQLAYYPAAEDLVVGRISGKAAVKATGEKVDFLVTEWFTLKDGKVAHIEVFYFDQAPLLRAIASDVASATD